MSTPMKNPIFIVCIIRLAVYTILEFVYLKTREIIFPAAPYYSSINSLLSQTFFFRLVKSLSCRDGINAQARN